MKPPPLEPLEFFSSLTAEQRKLWDAPPIAVLKKQVIVSPDQPDLTSSKSSNDVFFIREGRFEVSTNTEKGKPVIYRLLARGDLFGELSALDGLERSATVTALTAGQVLRIDGAAFKTLVETSPAVSMWLLQRHTALIRWLTDKLYHLMAYNVSARIIAEVVRMSEDAGASETNNHMRVPNFPQHHVLAARLNTTREAVTRELSRLGFKKEGKKPKADKPKDGKAKKPKKSEPKEHLELIRQKGRELEVFDFAGLKAELRKRTTV